MKRCIVCKEVLDPRANGACIKCGSIIQREKGETFPSLYDGPPGALSGMPNPTPHVRGVVYLAAPSHE